MTHVITTYGGGEVFELVFNAIAMLTHRDGNFLSPMMHLVLTVGSLYVAIVMFFKNDLREGVIWFLWAILATGILTTSTTRVWIRDPLSKTNTPVDHVPYVLGMVASKISQIGQVATEEMESRFTLPDDFKYHKTGTVFASALLMQIHNFRITDPEFKGNIERFVNQCVVLPAMIGSRFTLTDLHNSQDIWGLLKERSSPLLRFLYKPQDNPAAMVTCREGTHLLDAVWTQEIQRATLLYGRRINGKTLTKAIFDGYLSNSFELMTGIAINAETLLKQEMMINAIEDGSNNKLSEFGISSNYAATKALLQQRSTYAIAGDIAAKTLPLFKNVIEAIAYALFVFVMILALLPRGWKVLLTYFGMLVWLQLWAPLYAVLNLIMTLYGRHESLPYGNQGLTILTSSALHEAHADMVSLAAWLSISVPFLSYGILRQGAGAFLGMAQSLSAGMQAASSSVAAETISGNLSLGNVSIGTQAYQNVSAHQHNTSPVYSSGQMRALGENGIETITQANGATSFVDQGVSQMPFKIMANRDDSYAQQQQLNEATTLANTQSLSATQAQTAAYDKSLQATSQMAQLFQEGHDYTTSDQTSKSQSMSKVAQAMTEFRDQHGFSTGQALEAMAGASLSLPLKSLPISPSLGGNFTTQAARDTAISKAKSFLFSQSDTLTIDDLYTFGSSMAEHAGKSEDQNLSKTGQASLNEARTLTQQSEVSLSTLKSLQDSAISTQQQGTIQSEDITQRIIETIARDVGPSEAQKVVMGGMASMAPWVDKFYTAHPEYSPVQGTGQSLGNSLERDAGQSSGQDSVSLPTLRDNISTTQLEAQLTQDYTTTAQNLSQNTGAALQDAHSQFEEMAKTVSRENGLDPETFALQNPIYSTVTQNQKDHRAHIAEESPTLKQEETALQERLDGTDKSGLANRLINSTFGSSDLEVPTGPKPAFLKTLDHNTTETQDAYNRHVQEIQGYAKLGEEKRERSVREVGKQGIKEEVSESGQGQNPERR